MANEAEIAGRTDLIAKAMVETHMTMRDVLHGLEQVDRTIGRHLDDVHLLAGRTASVLGAERSADRVGEVAQRTGDHRYMEQWIDADREVRRTFGASQVAAGELSSRIGSGQRDLEELRDRLADNSGRLDQALKHLDALDELPEYGGSEQSAGLRNRLEQLKTFTVRADAGIRGTVDRLDDARRSAAAFEIGQVVIGESRHSNAVQMTSGSLRTTVSGARDRLRGTETGIYEERGQIVEARQFGITQANEGRAAQQAAELANAMRAASNPTLPSAQNTSSGQGEQDPRHRTDGPSRDSGLKR
jgi:hypothetical protein